MILDKLFHCHRYFNAYPGFKEAFKFLQEMETKPFSPARFELAGSEIIAIIESSLGRTRKGAKLEAHRKYIDIQYTFSGIEEIGWRPLAECQSISQPYNSDKDIEFFSDEPLCWLPLPMHSFAIFFPEDVHAPLASNQSVNKIIMKVPVIHSQRGK